MSQQPERSPADGAVEIIRGEGGELILSATQNGGRGALVVSEFNAWRLFGMLAVFLGVSLPKSVAKGIKP